MINIHLTCRRKLFVLGWVLLSTHFAFCLEPVSYNPTLPEGAVCNVEIDKLRPTQFAAGKLEVDRRAEKMARMKPKKLQEYLEEHRATIVIGPQGVPYIIDGHHLCSALLKLKLRDTVDAKVAANLGHLAPAEFWATMKEKGWTYLYDKNGRGPLEPDQLPKTIANLADDPYRSLAWVVREREGWEKSPASFAEFQWAAFFRSRIKIENRPGGFEKAVEEALRISHSPEAKDLPGYVP